MKGWFTKFSGSQMEDLGYIFHKKDMSFLLVNFRFGFLAFRLPKRWAKPNREYVDTSEFFED